MTAVEKFALCKALFDCQMPNNYHEPHVQQQWDAAVNAIGDVVSKTYAEGIIFHKLVSRDNWLTQDNPFKDDK